MMQKHCCISQESLQSKVGWPFNKLFARRIPPSEGVQLKKWPWYSRKPIETIQFSYEDRKGDFSTRVVDVFASTYSYFIGYCYHRKASRTFKVERIKGLVTVIQTGELMNPHQWASAIYSHPKNNHDVDIGGY